MWWKQNMHFLLAWSFSCFPSFWHMTKFETDSWTRESLSSSVMHFWSGLPMSRFEFFQKHCFTFLLFLSYEFPLCMRLSDRVFQVSGFSIGTNLLLMQPIPFLTLHPPPPPSPLISRPCFRFGQKQVHVTTQH